MPPWLPDDGTGDFAHARTLDDRETDMLVDWAIGLAPEGPAPEEEPAIPGAESDLPLSRLTLTEPVIIGEMESVTAVCRPLVRGEGVGSAAAGFALLPGEAVPILRRAVLYAGETNCGERGAASSPGWWGRGAAPQAGRGLRPPAGRDTGLFLHLSYRKGFDTEGLEFEDEPQVVVFPPLPDRTRAVEMLAVEPGTTPVGPATLLSVLPPEGLEPGPDGFAVEAVGNDGAVTPLLRIRRFDADWAEKFAFREPVSLADGAAIRGFPSGSDSGSGSHPGQRAR